MLRVRKCLPDFESLAEADAWRALNAPPRRHASALAPLIQPADTPPPPVSDPAQPAPSIPAEDPAPTPPPASGSPVERANIANMLAKLKSGRVLSRSEEARVLEYEAALLQASAPQPPTPTPAEKSAPPFPQNNNHPPKQPAASWIDTTAFLAAPGSDFDSLMLRHAEEVAQVAYGLYMRACSSGDAGQIAAHLKNWSDAVARAKDLREKFLEIQEKSRRLIDVDRAMDIVSTALQDLRLLLVGLGERVAPDANPTEPALAKRVVDSAIDAIFDRLSATSAALPEQLTA